MATKKMETPFSQGATRKRQRVIRIQVTSGDFPLRHKMKIFQNLKNQPFGIISQESTGFADVGYI